MKARSVATPKSALAVYSRLLGYVKPYWKGFGLSIAATVVASATEPLFPALMKPLLDQGFVVRDTTWLIWMPLAIVGIFILRAFAGFLASYGLSWVSNKVITDIRQEMFEKLPLLPCAYFDHHPSAVPITKIANDVNGVSAAATSVLTTVVRDTLSVLGLLVWLLYLNWKLTLITLAIIPTVGLLIRLFSRRLRMLSLAAQEAMARMNQVLLETIKGHKVIKIYGGVDIARHCFAKVNNELRGYGMRQAVAAASIAPITQIVGSVGLAVVVYIALHQSLGNETSVGGFVSFITAMLLLLAPLKHLADVNAPLQRGLAAAESVFQLLDEPIEHDGNTVFQEKVRGEIEFRGISLTYDSSEEMALSEVNLRISPGETIALVGPSGGGKTSLVNLLAAFYVPQEGGVLIDGKNISHLKRESLRSVLGHVGQDVFLFNDTVRANIAYGFLGAPSLSDQQIESAARAANAWEFISALPNGLDTVVGENGALLSGGQRQRLAIARALLKDAPILILDEATSALDAESEKLVQDALERLMFGRTTLVIAHRLSTVKHADRIVVLSGGRILEIGSHDDLLAQKGLYSGLYQLQFKHQSPYA